MPYYSPTTATNLRRKSPPTCTLSLAHVSAAPKFHSQPTTSSVKVKNAELNLSTMQVELQVDFSSVITVPVQVHVGDPTAYGPSAHSPSLRRSKSKKRIHLKRSEINVIPFPSATSSSSDNSSSHSNFSSPFTPTSTPHVLLRSSNPDVYLHSSPAVGATRRARKGTVNASVSISTSVRSTIRTSPTKNGSRLSSASQTRNVSQLPPRPSSPTPTHLTQTALQDKIQQLKNEYSFELPPYSSPPPPYSPSLESTDPADPKAARPLPIPSSTASSPPKSSRIPIAAPTPIAPQTQSRRPRASSSELKTLLFLYRTIMYGIERRHRLSSLKKQQQPTSSQPISPSTSPGRQSEIHFGRFPLVEDDEDADADDDDDDHPIFGGPRPRPRPTAPRMQRKLSSKSPAERAAKDFDVQDALLAIRLRVFLKSQGVSEEDLAVHFEEEEEEFGDEVILAARNPVAVPIVSPSPLPPRSQSQSEAGRDRPIRSSPPPLSPIPKASRSVPSVAYMIALIKMRNEQTPGQKLFSVVNDHGSSANAGRSSGRGRRSGLRSCAWVAGCDEKEVEEVEEEFDSDSVADWYAGLDY